MTRYATQTIYSYWSSLYKYTDGSGITKAGQNDAHLSMGYNDSQATSHYNAYQFTGWNWSGISRVISATMYMRLTSGTHYTRVGTYPTFTFGANYSSPRIGSGSHDGGDMTQVAAWSPGWDTTASLGGNAQGSTQSVDARSYIKRIAPPSVSVDGYGAGSGAVDYGCGMDWNNFSERTEMWSAVDGRKPYISLYVEYANVAPYTPSITAPANNTSYTKGDRTLSVSNAGDVDGDATYGRIEWAEVASYGTVPGGWNAATEGWSYTLPSASQTRGKWYAVRGRLRDEHSAYGSYSGTIWFHINSLPNAPVIT